MVSDSYDRDFISTTAVQRRGHWYGEDSEGVPAQSVRYPEEKGAWWAAPAGPGAIWQVFASPFFSPTPAPPPPPHDDDSDGGGWNISSMPVTAPSSSIVAVFDFLHAPSRTKASPPANDVQAPPTASQPMPPVSAMDVASTIVVSAPAVPSLRLTHQPASRPPAGRGQ